MENKTHSYDKNLLGYESYFAEMSKVIGLN
jgi:hypothetical protein